MTTMGAFCDLRRFWILVVLVGTACKVPNATREDVDSSVTAARCGNGMLDLGEICDDGNTLPNDGCSDDCLSDETCGNGVLDVNKGETCDDANSVGGDGCGANCQINEDCGNGTVNPGEQCDSNNQFTASCDPDCTPPVCGDGVRNPAANEQCDDGNTLNTDNCDSQCRIPVCGNDVIEGPEQCEDGNTRTNDACVNCRNNVCGDSFKWAGEEDCDDGNTVQTDA
jgi:cysteine-rich repeat protein